MMSSVVGGLDSVVRVEHPAVQLVDEHDRAVGRRSRLIETDQLPRPPAIGRPEDPSVAIDRADRTQCPAVALIDEVHVAQGESSGLVEVRRRSRCRSRCCRWR